VRSFVSDRIFVMTCETDREIKLQRLRLLTWTQKTLTEYSQQFGKLAFGGTRKTRLATFLHGESE
jgi:hypothetical protein